ncbi:MAG: magnesium transporter [Methanomassiliicoccales archaeon]|nr:magnesium transporter [Methanomassiliicoccales archaeon]MDD1756643.1 magnesium transporter [Methanomassiliicoccales archaeon]
MTASASVRGFVSRNRKVFTLGFVGLMISSVGDLLAGATLGSMTETLTQLAGLMILIPPAIGMRGNIFGALGSRLGTAMNIGTFELSMRKGSLLRQNFEASLLLTVIMSFLMGIMASAIATVLGVEAEPMEVFVFISVLGGVLAGIVLVFINILVADVGFRRGWDIDNFSAPIITAAGDVVTLPMLFLAAILVKDGFVSQAFLEAFAFVLLLLAAYLSFRVWRMKAGETRRIVVQTAPVLVLCILLDIGAGLTIDNQIEALVASAALLVVIPPFLEDANALGGVLTSRLASLLHMGTLEPKRFPSRLALENFAIIYIFSLWVFTLVGVTAYIVALVMGLGSPSLLELVGISLVAGLLTVTVLNFLSYYVAVLTFRFNLDPDDHSIPLTSSTIDFVGAIFFIAVVAIIGGL